MSPDTQQVAIAEACGYKWPGLRKKKDSIGWMLNGQYIPRLPNYLHSLDAMHEAEKTLTDANSLIYHANLLAVQRAQFGLVTDREFQMIHATAAQRAEAFLRTLNLWENNQ
jgi:hypothetical protein